MTNFVEPSVRLIARPNLDWPNLEDYLDEKDAEVWGRKVRRVAMSTGESLIEFAGRMCYRSWKPGLNPNVTRVRTDSAEYLENILKSGHGSVLEHATYTFVFSNVSRVLTHELVRHRAGCAVSQESMRYVRLTDIPMWIPDRIKNDPEMMDFIVEYMDHAEEFQRLMTDMMGLEDEGVSFHSKKMATSFMRRFIPMGVATEVTWTANIRALRHIIASRTATGAEEEIRLVFGQVAELMQSECPLLFGDFQRGDDGTWTTEYQKV